MLLKAHTCVGWMLTSECTIAQSTRTVLSGERWLENNLSWFRDFTEVRQGGFENGDVAWFTGGKLNVSYNCIDRHVKTRGDQVAIIWEGDEPGNVRKITYKELLRNVCQIAEVFKKNGVKKGDCVTLYMPMIQSVPLLC